jgi:DNA-directed RNA polymerase subunit delta
MKHTREIAMLAIQGLKCIYDTTGRGWAMEITLEGEHATKRFDLDGAEDAEMLIDAFEDSSASHFDPETGEISFAYEYAEHLAEDEEDEDAEDESAEADADDGEDDDTTRKVA